MFRIIDFGFQQFGQAQGLGNRSWLKHNYFPVNFWDEAKNKAI